MAKKKTKTLLSALLCATLVVGTAATVYAAEAGCPHSYQILNDYEYNYTYMNPDEHRVTGWEEYYCMDCGAYWTEYVNFTEDHFGSCCD